MKQVLLTRAGVEVREVPAPQVEPGAVLVRVSHSCISVGTEMSGVRDSNLPLWRRALQRPDQVRRLAGLVVKEGFDTARAMVRTKLAEAQPIGYSAVGRIVAVGDGVSDLAVGDRVGCAGAQGAHHAEFICVRRNLVVAVPEPVSDHDAATVTLGAIALQGVRRLQPTLGESVVVIGLGVIGQITVQLLKSAGARVIGVDIDRARLAEALALGLDAAVHPDDIEPTAQAARLTDGYGADGVIVTAATSSSEVISAAFRMCRRKARVVLVGDVGLDIERADIYAKELDFLISTSYGPGRYERTYEEAGLDYPIAYVRWTENRNLAEYLRQIADGRVRLDKMAGSEFPVDRAGDAYGALADAAERPLFAILAYDASGAGPISRHVERRASGRAGAGAIRLALIGAGNFAKAMHLPLLQKMPQAFALRAVVSRRGYEAETLARQYDAPVSATDVDVVLDDGNIDAVLIATRHDSHAELVIRALEKGKHVLVEKPLCLTKSQLTDIEAVVERLGDRCPVLMTGFNRRFSPHAAAAKALLDRRSNPLIADYRVNAGYIALDHWVHGAAGGGRNIGEASHFYDFIGYLADAAVATVEARAIRPKSAHYTRNDNFVALVTFEDGSVGNLTYTALGSPDFPKELLDIYSDGRVLQIIDFRDFQAAGCKVARVKQHDKGHAGELAAFRRAVLGETAWPIPLWQQTQAMRIAFRVEELLHRGTAADECADGYANGHVKRPA
jgi:predicted dehydrogenase/threonine dehydrogenase-like Zn-dependent dehydrogenase